MAETGGFASGQSAPGGNTRSGAALLHTYLDRHQKFFVVNKNDLEDIRDFDGVTRIAYGCGMFFLSGATWLAVPDILMSSEGSFEMSPLLWFCLLCVIFGVVLLCMGWALERKRSSRIQRIYNELVEIPGHFEFAQRSAGVVSGTNTISRGPQARQSE